MSKCIVFALCWFLFGHPVLADNSIVKTALLKSIATYPERFASATSLSLNEPTISAEISAPVKAIHVRVGDLVKAGDLLAELDCSDYVLARKTSEASLASTNARIELAQRRYKRTQKLLLKKSISQEDLDERDADLSVLYADKEGAKSNLALAKLNEKRCQVVSPFTALVVERNASVGQLASVGSALIKLLDYEHIEVSAQVYSDDAAQLSSSKSVYFEHGSQRYDLALRTVLPAINVVTRNQEARLSFLASSALPGAAGKIVWKDQRPHVPGELLVRREKELGVFIVEKGIARFIKIPAAQAGRATPVDLAPDSQLVTDGYYGLKDAVSVTVKNNP